MLIDEILTNIEELNYGSMGTYSNNLVKELDINLHKWHVFSPTIPSEVKYNQPSANATFIISKRQGELNEKEAVLKHSEDFKEFKKQLEVILQRNFQNISLKKESLIANFAKVWETERKERNNFGGQQIISLLLQYKLTAQEGYCTPSDPQPIVDPLVSFCPLNGDFKDYSGNGNDIDTPATPSFVTMGGREVLAVLAVENITSFSKIPVLDYINNFKIEIEFNKYANRNGAFTLGSGGSANINGIKVYNYGSIMYFYFDFNLNLNGFQLSNNNILINKWYKIIFENRRGNVKIEIIDVDNGEVKCFYNHKNVGVITTSTYNKIGIGGEASEPPQRPALSYFRNFKLFKYDD